MTGAHLKRDYRCGSTGTRIRLTRGVRETSSEDLIEPLAEVPTEIPSKCPKPGETRTTLVPNEGCEGIQGLLPIVQALKARLAAATVDEDWALVAKTAAALLALVGTDQGDQKP